MAANEILFKDLPFSPKVGEVFYVERDYDEEANNFIRRNYAGVKAMFARMGMDFCYLPYLMKKHDIEAKMRYYAPYLSPGPLTAEVGSNVLVPYISDDETRQSLRPSLVFGGRMGRGDGETRFGLLGLGEVDLTATDAIGQLKHATEERLKAMWRDEACFAEMTNFSKTWEETEDDNSDGTMERESATAPFYDVCEEERDGGVYFELDIAGAGKGMWDRLFRRFGRNENVCSQTQKGDDDTPTAEDDLADGGGLVETEKVLRELRLAVRKLRLEGVSLVAIHEFIDKQEPLSRLKIAPDYRIFLPDYNNMEIEMGALPKALYLLYLRHPEGIVCKHMQDHYGELLDIYSRLRPYTDEARRCLTITKVVNPLGNALNENIARIRKAFVEKFDEHLATNYIVTGERGERYAIRLDRALVEGDEVKG